MIAVDKQTLPKRITQGDISNLIGEHAYWYCPACRKWRTTPITAEGIACSVCGGAPDWEKRPPTLSYMSRYKRVADLCAFGSDFRRKYEDAERQYADYIDQMYAGMPAGARDTGWQYFQNVWQEADKVADYLITAQDTPVVAVPYAFNEDGLRRRYYDPRRVSNVVSLSDLTDNNGVCFTYDTAEIASYTAGYMHHFDDKRFGIIEYWEDIFDPMERAVARDLSEGYTKRDIERRYGLSERRVRTIVSHIAKSPNKS